MCVEALLGPEINLQITTHSNSLRGVNEGCFLSDHVSTTESFGFWRWSPRKHRFVLNTGFYEDEGMPCAWRNTHIWRSKKHVACGRRGTVGSPRSLESWMESWTQSTATMGLNTCSPAGNKWNASRQLWKVALGRPVQISPPVSGMSQWGNELASSRATNCLALIVSWWWVCPYSLRALVSCRSKRAAQVGTSKCWAFKKI